MAIPTQPRARSVLAHGLQASFAPLDARKECVRGIWPAAELQQSEEALLAAVGKLELSLVSDTYGGVQAVARARDAYNARPGFHVFRRVGYRL